jgi:exoribonuclease R
MPQGIGMASGLDENLRLQDRMAQKLKALRHQHGALDLETIQTRPVFVGDELKDLEADKANRAKGIIEDFMIAANGVTARYLAAKQFPSLRRVVREPKRWAGIVELAAERGSTLTKEAMWPRETTARSGDIGAWSDRERQSQNLWGFAAEQSEADGSEKPQCLWRPAWVVSA